MSEQTPPGFNHDPYKQSKRKARHRAIAVGAGVAVLAGVGGIVAYESNQEPKPTHAQAETMKAAYDSPRLAGADIGKSQKSTPDHLIHEVDALLNLPAQERLLNNADTPQVIFTAPVGYVHAPDQPYKEGTKASFDIYKGELGQTGEGRVLAGIDISDERLQERGGQEDIEVFATTYAPTDGGGFVSERFIGTIHVIDGGKRMSVELGTTTPMSPEDAMTITYQPDQG